MAPPAALPPGQLTDRIVGQSPAIQAVRLQILHLVSFDAIGKAMVPTLLLSGETGTGKGLVARVVHDSGPRAHGPFIEVNCAAIPEALLEAEVFGFEAGAFTDARRSKPGLFEVASGGTLFLDEIDALPLALQSKFLKAIEEKRVRRLGAVRERAVDIKLIAATQAELSSLVREGRFRPDLYHRLAVVMLALPPLRQRAEDVLLLAHHYVHQYAEAHGLAPIRLHKAAEAWLLRHDWPGNVRELSHLMERVTLLSPQAVVDAATLERLSLPQPSSLTALPVRAVHGPVSLDEPARIEQALIETGGNVARAARLLSLGRGALRHRMRRYGVQRSSSARALAAPAVPAKQATRGSEAVSEASPKTDWLASPAAWEQRTVVVLAIDITLPQATTRHTPRYEPWPTALRWERAIIEKVQGFGGLLVQRSPSLLLVVFGIPHTLEQMPQRAIQAALAVRHLLVEEQRPEAAEPCPEVRLAVHLGVVAVDVEASDPTPRLLAMGDTLALATRLLGHAGAGDLVVSPHVGRLVEGWFELQPRALSLSAEPHSRMVAYTVAGLRPQRTPVVLQGGHPLSPFVGRERELVALLDLLARVEAGHGQVVGIVGEPGMGKSRLLYEFRQRLQGAPITYLEGHCLAYGSPIPLLPVLDLLRHMWDITPADDAEAMTAKVHTTLRECGMDPAAEAPYLLQLLGVRDGMDGLRGLTPEALKLRTFATLRQLSRCSSQRQPLILAVENLHWIDQTSQDFLASLVENLTNASILLLTTSRPGYCPPWMEKSYTTQLALPPLSPGDSLRVVSSIFPTGQVPTALAQTILEKAEGNPFFLEELAQALVEHGDHVSPRGVPDTVQGVLMARIDRLPDGPRRLLQTAAMLDRTVPLRLLRELWEGPGLLDTALLGLQRAEFLSEQIQANEPVYGFKHVLMQDVVYQTLPASRRKKLHASVGWSMEQLYRGQLEEHHEELAYHFFQGEIWDKACAYAVHSGDKARAIFSNREAVHFYTLALEAAGCMTPPPDDVRLISLYAHRGQVWSLLTNCDAAVADFEAMLERARCLGDRHREGEALCHLAQAHWHQFSEVHIGIAEAYAQEALAMAGETGDDQVRARSLISLALVHQVRGQLHAGDQKLEESLAIVRHKQYTEIMPATLVWLGAHANWRGEFQRAIELSLEGARMARQVHDGFQELFALSFLCLAYAGLGEWDLAFATLHEGMAKAKQWDNTFIISRLTNTLGWFYSELGDVARACEYDQEGYELGRASKVSNTEISALINLGFDHLHLERSEAARRLLEEAFDRVEREVFGSHRWRWKIRLCLGLGRLWHREQESAKALAFLSDGLRLALATGSQKYVAEGRGLRGEILVAAGQRDQGLRELQQGFALARSLSCPTLTWRLAQLLGRTYERWGDMRQAQEMYTTAVTDAMAVAERLHDTRLQATLLASPQVTSVRDDLVRLGRLGG